MKHGRYTEQILHLTCQKSSMQVEVEMKEIGIYTFVYFPATLQTCIQAGQTKLSKARICKQHNLSMIWSVSS